MTGRPASATFACSRKDQIGNLSQVRPIVHLRAQGTEISGDHTYRQTSGVERSVSRYVLVDNRSPGLASLAGSYFADLRVGRGPAQFHVPGRILGSRRDRTGSGPGLLRLLPAAGFDSGIPVSKRNQSP